MPVDLFVCLSVRPSIGQSVCLVTCPFIYKCICLSVWLTSICLPVHLSVCLLVWLSVGLFGCLSECLSIYMYNSLSVWLSVWPPVDLAVCPSSRKSDTRFDDTNGECLKPLVCLGRLRKRPVGGRAGCLSMPENADARVRFEWRDLL